LERRLAAILAADVVGYSRLMGADQNKTLEALRQLRGELFDPVVTRHRGNIVKRMGDGWIVEFPSISDAVACAIAIQDSLSGHDTIRLRIGIHIGEVVFEADDVFGDGVNIAARLEAIAEPGQVLISDTALSSLDKKAAQQFIGGETKKLKNVDRPVAIWRWPATSDANVPAELEPLALPDKPSIAVLPFNNMSGDPEQEYFSDGITEDIITELSRFGELFVIARNSSFVFKNKAVDIREVGRSLGVRYVLEGSVRKAGNRIRVTAQLVDATKADHIWAERYDRELIDIFEIQDDLSRSIVTTIKGRVEVNLIKHTALKPTNSLSSYECVLRAQSLVHQYTEKDFDKARILLEKAILLDPNFARAYGWLAYVEAQDRIYWRMSVDELNRAIDIGEKGLTLDSNESNCHLALGLSFLFSKEHDKAEHHLTKASLLNPNDDLIMVELCRYKMYTGEPDQGAVYLRRGMRQNPYHPNWYWNILARCLHTAKDYLGAISALDQIEVVPFWSHAYYAACYAELDQMEEAKKHVDIVLSLMPDFSIKQFETIFPYRDQNVKDDFIASFQRAGLQ